MVGERTIKYSAASQTEEKERDDHLPVIVMQHGKITPYVRQRRQHRIYRQRSAGDQSCHQRHKFKAAYDGRQASLISIHFFDC